MFKELGEFIDNAGRRVGFIAKKLLSKDELIDGYISFDRIEDEDLDELVKQGIITKEEAEAIKNGYINDNE